MRRLLTALALIWVGTAAFSGCGTDPDACEIDGGSYHIKLPDGEPRGTIVFLHGWGGSGAGTINNRRWVPATLNRGFAVIAPDGMPRQGRNGRSWSFHPEWPQARDEISFLQHVRDDAAQRFGLDPDAMMLGGFSIGGSMTHYLACAAPDAFFAYIPVGGAFWRTHPTDCGGPVRMLHTHGWADTTVPLEGRVVRGEDVHDPNAFIQGDVFYAMRLWRAENGCDQLRGDRFNTDGAFWRRSWVRCAPGTALELALFPGGHTVPNDWAPMMLDWVEGL
ncbi:MAG: alpha/beta fold hydrolase [Pseudomonadota bacterium]